MHIEKLMISAIDLHHTKQVILTAYKWYLYCKCIMSRRVCLPVILKWVYVRAYHWSLSELPEIIIQQPHVTLTGIITLNAVFQLSLGILFSYQPASITGLPSIMYTLYNKRVHTSHDHLGPYIMGKHLGSTSCPM